VKFTHAGSFVKIYATVESNTHVTCDFYLELALCHIRHVESSLTKT